MDITRDTRDDDIQESYLKALAAFVSSHQPGKLEAGLSTIMVIGSEYQRELLEVQKLQKCNPICRNSTYVKSGMP